MFNPRLMGVVVCSLASCAGQPQQVAREQQDHDAECRKFGAASDTATYIDCRVALRAIERLQQAAPPLKSPMRREAVGLVFSRDSGEEKPRQLHGKGSKAISCAEIEAGQLIVFECGLSIPLADLLGALDP
jgi:hypothetical protein